jgi:hypothetical protein
MFKKSSFNINIGSKKPKKENSINRSLHATDGIIDRFTKDLEKGIDRMLENIDDDVIQGTIEKVKRHFKENNIDWNVKNFKIYVEGAMFQLTTSIYAEFRESEDGVATDGTARRAGVPMAIHAILRQILRDLEDEE